MKDGLEAVKEVDARKIKYEVEMGHCKQQISDLTRTIKEEKYNIQIEQAKMKKAIEAEYKELMEKFKAQAQLDAERNIQDIERNIHYENQKLSE